MKGDIQDDFMLFDRYMEGCVSLSDCVTELAEMIS